MFHVSRRYIYAFAFVCRPVYYSYLVHWLPSEIILVKLKFQYIYKYTFKWKISDSRICLVQTGVRFSHLQNTFNLIKKELQKVSCFDRLLFHLRSRFRGYTLHIMIFWSILHVYTILKNGLTGLNISLILLKSMIKVPTKHSFLTEPYFIINSLSYVFLCYLYNYRMAS